MTELHIVIDGPPGGEPDGGRFVEVETKHGRSVRVGEWVQRGRFWRLVLTPDAFPTEEEDREQAADNGQFGVDA